MLEAFVENDLTRRADVHGLQLLLVGIILAIDAKKVLELGVRDGNTTGPLLAGVALTKGKLTSVDIALNPDTLSRFADHNWTAIQSDALEFLATSTESWDLVLIDDCHDGGHVMREIALLESYVTPSSLILIHDTMAHSVPMYSTYSDYEFTNGGPAAAIARLNHNTWEIATVPASHGLTMLRKLA